MRMESATSGNSAVDSSAIDPPRIARLPRNSPGLYADSIRRRMLERLLRSGTATRASRSEAAPMIGKLLLLAVSVLFALIVVEVGALTTF